MIETRTLRSHPGRMNAAHLQRVPKASVLTRLPPDDRNANLEEPSWTDERGTSPEGAEGLGLDEVAAGMSIREPEEPSQGDERGASPESAALA